MQPFVYMILLIDFLKGANRKAKRTQLKKFNQILLVIFLLLAVFIVIIIIIGRIRSKLRRDAMLMQLGKTSV